MLILASVVLAALTCTQPASRILVGRWESHDISRGGIGQVIDFREDGSFVTAISVIVKLHYELHGNTLAVTDPSASPGSEQPPPTSIRFEGETLVEEAPGGSPLRRDRVGVADSGKSSIVGVWRYRHYTGGIAFERYTPDGDLFLRLPMTSSKGCYALAAGKNEVVLTTEGGAPKTVSFMAEGTQLKIQSAGSPADTFDRSAWGAWYDIDNIDIQPPARQP